MMAPRVAYILILGICENLPSMAKRALRVQLRILKQQGYSQLVWWVQCGQKDLYKKEPRGSKSEKGDVMTGAKVGMMQFEDGGRLHKGSYTGSLRCWKMQGNRFFI